MVDDSLSLYFHWPFCQFKCPYCDFNSHVALQINLNDWLQAYKKAIYFNRDLIKQSEIKSIYFGGGTPSLMEAQTVQEILNTVQEITKFDPEIEITLEANPSTFEIDKFEAFHNAGINRLSVGLQSLHQEQLDFLGRKHSAHDAISAVEQAKDIFPRVTFDVIYTLPKQTLDDWKNDLDRIIQLASGHLSLYQLTIEKGTPFYLAEKHKEFMMPSENETLNFYHLTNEKLKIAGYSTYEISNYAKPGQESIHNKHYWAYGDYLGIGPGAHSRISKNNTKIAYMDIHQPQQWLNRVLNNHHGIQQKLQLSSEQQLEEILMMGLRTNSGVNISLLEQLLKSDVKKTNLYQPLLHLVHQNLLTVDKDSIKATDNGKMLIHSIVAKLTS